MNITLTSKPCAPQSLSRFKHLKRNQDFQSICIILCDTSFYPSSLSYCTLSYVTVNAGLPTSIWVQLRIIRNKAALDIYFLLCGATQQHNPKPESGQQRRIRSRVLDLLRCLGMTLPVHGTSNYTGIQTSHVFRPKIELGSTAWKSRRLTTQLATH